MTSDKCLTVRQLNEYVKLLLDNDALLSGVFVKGEISNFTNHYKTGHLYFSLKDNDGLVRAVMFRGDASKLTFRPENGMKVIVGGRVSAFVRDGQYQLYVHYMQPDGAGALYVALEQLKAKLQAEGLFAESAKRRLPSIPSRIGIVTSPTGAAIQDMIHIIGRRAPYAEIVLYPALVQGEGAPRQLVAGLSYFNQTRSVDLIIIGRGGGSAEDLWAFNDEGLVRAVAASTIPVISAVGHESDYTLCDLAADKRAPTPSAAAEIAVPDGRELKRHIHSLGDRVALLAEGRVTRAAERLAFAANARVLRAPEDLLADKRQDVDYFSEKLMHHLGAKVSEGKLRLAGTSAKLSALNPLAILSRGYSIATNDTGDILKSVDGITRGDALRVRLSDGVISATVTDIEAYE